MEFTFGIITYNHEKFILELLESIKYQILTFGEGVSVELVISDDASRDDTVKLVNGWVEMNQGLFARTEILVNEKNAGVVENFKKIMHSIKGDCFKVIAGDDVFADHNVFRCLDGEDENNLVTYVPVVLKNAGLSLKTDWYAKHFLYMGKRRTHRYDVIKQEEGSYFHTPCTFYRRKLYTDYYENHPTNLRLFEDDPLWHTILSKNDKARVVFKNDYLVLYRMHDNAICSSGVSPYAKEFDMEMKKYKKQIMREEKNIAVKLYLMLQIYSPKNRYLNIMNYVTKAAMWRRNVICKYNGKCREGYLAVSKSLEKTREYYVKLLEDVAEAKKMLQEKA